mgnify:CR=1 FL=1
MDFYTVLHDNTTTVEDFSLLAKDFTTNPVDLVLEDTHYLYAGYYKPFKQLFIELATANTNTNNLNAEYFNGTSWQPLSIIDESQGLVKSGFIYFEKPADWALATVDSVEEFYIRLQPSVSHSVGTVLQGLGILLSNDLDLEGIKSNIVSKLNNGNSWVGKHEAARKYIIQKLRNLGYRKYIPSDANNPLLTASGKSSAIYFSDLTEFDLLAPFELREASKFYALSYIYLDELSDEQDDKWERAGRRHLKRAEEAINVFMLKIDSNDNGEEDNSESPGDTGISLSWA